VRNWATQSRFAGIYLELGEHGLGDAVEQGCLVRCVAVNGHRVTIELAGEAAHGQPVDPVAVDELQCGGSTTSRVILPSRLASAPETVRSVGGSSH